MDPKKLLVLLAVGLLAFACNKEDEEEEPQVQVIDNATFSQADLDILQSVLILDAQPFNYSNISLPAHYRGEEVEEYDNTPTNNPITNMGATLGRVLFYDTKLSANNTISCASCHQQSAGFSDNRQFSIGLNGDVTPRNSMGLINARYYPGGRFMWDESAASLEAQVLMPIENHEEMDMRITDLEAKLRETDYYPVLFRNAFGSETINSERISKALAQFIRSIVAVDSKFDRAMVASGNPDMTEGMELLSGLSEQENVGLDIFQRGRNGSTCHYCHGTPQTVSKRARNNGLQKNYTDNGAGNLTGHPAHEAIFKAPSLRNIANTAPYMHDGRFATLEEVVDHYSENVASHANLDFRLTTDEKTGGNVMRLNLSSSEKKALVAFLHTLTDESVLTAEKYSDPFK